MLKIKYGTGWIPDIPSSRDYSIEHGSIKPLLEKLKVVDIETDIPHKTDLREWFSPIEQQGFMNSCTAHTGTALMEYFQQRAYGKSIKASRLFLYKTARNLLQLKGNTPVHLRTIMEAMTLFGLLPEKYWPFEHDKLDEEPTAFCYAYADNYKAVKYFKVDTPNCQPEELLKRIKLLIAGGIPAMFGFSIFSSMSDKEANKSGKIPFPGQSDMIQGGHALIAAGYDDTLEIHHPDDKNNPTTGAILIRNSWGTVWGDSGYGWMPYKYITAGLTKDWWVLIKSSWVDTDEFGIPKN